MSKTTELSITGCGGEFTHDLKYTINRTAEEIKTEINWALEGTQGLRAFTIQLNGQIIVIPSKVLHHSRIIIKSI
jgi:hypothetical protein